MTIPFPNPSKLFAILSALIIAGSLFLVSSFIATSVVDPNPLAILGGLIVLPICLFLAAQQYRGTFRRVPSAAHATSLMLYIVGAFLTFGVATSTAEVVGDFKLMRRTVSILAPMLLIALATIVVGRMNALWCRKMLAALDSGAEAPAQGGFSLRELLLGVGVIAAMIGAGFQLIRSAPPQHAEHIAASAAPFELPTGATDVSYGKGVRGTVAYEFNIDEPAFRQWVDSGIGSIQSQAAGIPLQEITSPYTIPRYGAMSPEVDGPDEITVNQGLYYSWTKDDRGVYAAFDRATGRAYYHAHYH